MCHLFFACLHTYTHVYVHVQMKFVDWLLLVSVPTQKTEITYKCMYKFVYSDKIVHRFIYFNKIRKSFLFVGRT